MADFLDSRHWTSDEFIDPYCDPCCEDEGLNVRVHGFCKDCVQFLCSDCHSVHRKLQSSRHHHVVQGEDMPKSQVEKPPRFEYCNVHPKLLKDAFCCEHKVLLCNLCSSSDHKGCFVKTVQDACGDVDVSETGALYDKIKTLQENLKSAMSSFNKNVSKLKDQQKTMLRDTQMIYDQVLARLNKMFDDIKKEIQTSCHTQMDISSHQHKKFNDIVTKLESPLTRLGELKTTPIDTKVFLRLQGIVSYANKLTTELHDSHKQHKSISLSFTPSQTVQDFLSSSLTFGTIRSSDSSTDADIVIPEIIFPVSPLKQKGTRPKTRLTPDLQNIVASGTIPFLSKPTQPASRIKATKQGSINIKTKYDTSNVCLITSMAITKDRRLLMADSSSDKIKLFSLDTMPYEFVSSVSVPGRPGDIAVISDKKAVVAPGYNSLVILDISGRRLCIKSTTKLSYHVQGISRYKNKLVVTSPVPWKTYSVKLIDLTGRIYWSVLSDQEGQSLLSSPCQVSCPGDGRSATVIVAAEDNHTLTLLNGGTGEVITRRQLKRKDLKGVTSDCTGNVYVSYSGSVAVLSKDFSMEKTLLSRQDDFGGHPNAIVYDDEVCRLIISYCNHAHGSFWGCDHVDVFQLS